jgi:hypothetical protein
MFSHVTTYWFLTEHWGLFSHQVVLFLWASVPIMD